MLQEQLRGASFAPPSKKIDYLRPQPSMLKLLMKTKGAINGGYIGDGVLVDKDIPLDFQQNGKIIERLDIPFHLVAGHELHYDLNPLLA
jgi:hypothetical protein